MSQLNANQSEELRHERKFLIANYSASDIEQFLKFHPFCFTEIYQERQVNNIYFDTLGFASYYGNTDGDMNREKVRIRWYGNLFGEINAPVLEFKIKKGLLGKKEFYSLAPFKLDSDFSKKQITFAMNKESVPKKTVDYINSLQPTLLNSYFRKYFISADKNYRITIDKKLSYYYLSYNQNKFLNRIVDHSAVVLELKYDSKFEDEVKDIGNYLPFKMTKNSKYLQGIENILF